MSSLSSEDRAPSAELAQAWRQDVATEAELRQAYLRFLQKRPAPRRPHPLQVLGWLAAGMLLGMGSLYAASAPWKALNFGWGRAAERAAVAPAPAAKPALPPSPSSWPPPLPVTSSGPNRTLVPQPVLPTPGSAVAARESWERAAQGLRERDFDTANQALLRLAEQGDSTERETAQLVRAQLLLSQGRAPEAEQLLRALQRAAGSPSIRDKAQELLAAPRKSTPSERSFEPLEGTKLP